MRIYLVRHGKAEAEAAGGDATRALTPEGRHRFLALARSLAPKLHVRRILASPFERARQTAELLGQATGAPVLIDRRLASGRTRGEDLVALAEAEGDGTALVGHNPETSEAVSLAAGADQRVQPGTVAAIDLDGGRPTLAWLEAPPRIP